MRERGEGGVQAMEMGGTQPMQRRGAQTKERGGYQTVEWNRGKFQDVARLLTKTPHKENDVTKVRVEAAAALFGKLWEDPSGLREEVGKARANGQEIHVGSLSSRIQEAIDQGKDTVRLSIAPLPTAFGDWTEVLYGDLRTGYTHKALVYGNFEGGSLGNKEDVLVRLHSSHYPNEIFSSYTSDDQKQREAAMKIIQKTGRGILLYEEAEGRGHGPVAQHEQFQNIYEWDVTGKLKSKVDKKTGRPLNVDDGYRLAGRKTENRDNTYVAEIFKDLGVKSIIMLTNNMGKINQMEKAGMKVKGFAKLKVDSGGNGMVASYQNSQSKGNYIAAAA